MRTSIELNVYTEPICVRSQTVFILKNEANIMSCSSYIFYASSFEILHRRSFIHHLSPSSLSISHLSSTYPFCSTSISQFESCLFTSFLITPLHYISPLFQLLLSSARIHLPLPDLTCLPVCP